MQQFTVPQFIDVESKILGPITTRQFLIFVVAAIIIGLSYKLFDFALFITISLPVFSLAGTLAFFKINGRPFHFFLLNLVQTFRRPPLRVWNHKLGISDNEEIKVTKYADKESFEAKELKRSRLAELSLIVDTQGRYQGEDNGDIDTEIMKIDGPEENFGGEAEMGY
ncbi:MAG: PrgI family protein [Planctomycetes bacterium]|jgi:hypothetical protein|nr:PrgI family protein [Planctomycetota bacterium]